MRVVLTHLYGLESVRHPGSHSIMVFRVTFRVLRESGMMDGDGCSKTSLQTKISSHCCPQPINHYSFLQLLISWGEPLTLGNAAEGIFHTSGQALAGYLLNMMNVLSPMYSFSTMKSKVICLLWNHQENTWEHLLAMVKSKPRAVPTCAGGVIALPTAYVVSPMQKT